MSKFIKLMINQPSKLQQLHYLNGKYVIGLEQEFYQDSDTIRVFVLDSDTTEITVPKNILDKI